jgi:hypothetical protein
LLGEPCLHCSAVQCSSALRCVAWAKLSYPLACCCVRVAGGGQPTGATWMKEGFAMRLLQVLFLLLISFPSLPFCPPSTCNKASQILPQQILPRQYPRHLLTFFCCSNCKPRCPYCIFLQVCISLPLLCLPQQVAQGQTLSSISHRGQNYRNCELSLPHFDL